MKRKAATGLIKYWYFGHTKKVIIYFIFFSSTCKKSCDFHNIQTNYLILNRLSQSIQRFRRKQRRRNNREYSGENLFNEPASVFLAGNWFGQHEKTVTSYQGW